MTVNHIIKSAFNPKHNPAITVVKRLQIEEKPDMLFLTMYNGRHGGKTVMRLSPEQVEELKKVLAEINLK